MNFLARMQIKAGWGGQDLAGAYVKDLCQKAGRSELFDPNPEGKSSWDDFLNPIAYNLIRKNPIHIDSGDYPDLIMAALMNITSLEISKFNRQGQWPDKQNSSFPKYIAHFFQMRMINPVLQSLFNKNKRTTYKPSSDDRTDDEWMDSRRSHPSFDGEGEIQYKDLVQKLIQYLKSKPDGRYYETMFPMLLNGSSSGEVAQKLGVSEGLISRYLTRMKEEIMSFAKSTNNNELFDLMSGYLHKRRHTLRTADNDDFAALREVFETYRRKVGSIKVAEDDSYYYENRPSRHQETPAPEPKLTVKKYDKNCYQVFRDGRIIGTILAFANGGGWSGYDLRETKLAGTFGLTAKDVLEKWPVDSIKTEGGDEEGGESEVDYSVLINRLKQDILLAERRISRNPDPVEGQKQMQMITHYMSQIEDLQKKKQDADFAAGSAARADTGPFTEVSRSIRPDPFEENYRSTMLLSDKISQATIDNTAKDFLEFCGSAGDLVENDGKIVGLSIHQNEIRANGRQQIRYSKVAETEDNQDKGEKHPSPDAEFANTEGCWTDHEER